jgi:hypothetical protein
MAHQFKAIPKTWKGRSLRYWSFCHFESWNCRAQFSKPGFLSLRFRQGLTESEIEAVFILKAGLPGLNCKYSLVPYGSVSAAVFFRKHFNLEINGYYSHIE